MKSINSSFSSHIKISKFKIFLFFLYFFSYKNSSSQLLRTTCSGNVSAYNWYRNPSTADTLGKSSGSAVYNFGASIGITLGSDMVGIMAKGNTMFSIFNFDLKQNKGFSAFSYGATGLIYIGHPNEISNFSLMFGGGFQLTKTELWVHPKKYKGFSRPYFVTYIGEIILRPGFFEGESLFLRAGVGENKSVSVEAGVCVHVDLIGHIFKK